eukprot:TRINITY_DN67112_c5_g3_i1.p1 TRINITY_DN67112_c5_g3~~TRINITY_DN67112_c5_g3_i1.p1  ORF type:complete len:533 (-),score=82.11 TRINITY_DN67112_c5_g3_i1:1038-2636(-)
MPAEPGQFDAWGSRALKFSSRLAMIDRERQITWSQFITIRNRLANSLMRLGYDWHKRGAVYGKNSADWTIADIACNGLGVTVVPVNWHLARDEVAYVLTNSGAEVLFFDLEFGENVAQMVARGQIRGVKHFVIMQSENHIAAITTLKKNIPGCYTLEELIAVGMDQWPATPNPEETNAGFMMYTSGTTGKPKGAVRKGSNAPPDPAYLKQLGMLQVLSGPIHLICAPMYHALPVAMYRLSFAMGGTLVYQRKFNANQALELINKHKINCSCMPPILLKRLLQADPEFLNLDTSSMKCIITGGAPCADSIKQGMMKHLGPVLTEIYGASELGIVTILNPQDSIRKPGSCGVLVTGREFCIMDDNGNKIDKPGVPGTVYVKRDQSVFTGYHGDAEKTKKSFRDQWATVSDVAYVDADGYMYIVDRKIDMILSGAVNIYPAEVENVLHQHAAIEDVAVFGTPDEEFGEQVHAAIQLRPGHKLTANELKQWCDGKIARFKIPKQITFHDQLPRTEAGKLMKRRLRDKFWEGRKAKL